MKANEGCMVISIEEARILLDALNASPLNSGELEGLHCVKQRM